MFRNLLKYDMRAVWKIWRFVALGMLIFSFAGAFVLRYITENSEKIIYSGTLIMLLWMMIMLIIMAVLATSVITHVFVYLRFYKNFFTDEGYLTFTLPTSRKLLLRSKTVSALIFTVMLFLLYAVSTVIFALIVPASAEGELINFAFFKGIGELFSAAWREIGFWTVVFVFLGIVFALASAFYSVSVFHFCITVGSMLVKKAKVLLSIGIYIGFGMASSTVSTVARMIYFLTLNDGFLELTSDFTMNQDCILAALIMLLICAVTLTVSFVIHSLTRYFIERKLNLS